MSASLRLFTIETRRTFALWLIPVAVAASWLLVRGALSLELALWIESSIAIRDSVIFAGPLITGGGAWVAGREHRRGMRELLATTPRPAAARDLANWAATAFAGTAAYAVILLYVGAITSAKATWDGPYWGPIAGGFLAMVAHAATGYAFGRYFPSRFTAPVIATLLFLGQLYVGRVAGGNRAEEMFLTKLDTIFGELRYLSPVANLQRNIWYGIWPDLALAQAMWLVGVAAVALALVALHDSQTLTTAVLTIAALILAVGGGAATALGSPDDPAYEYWNPGSQGEVIPFQPVCAEGEITVCVHPAFEPWLDDIAETANQVTLPLVGLPGMPERAEQSEGRYRALPPNVVEIYLYPFDTSPDAAAQSIIRCAVRSCNPPAEEMKTDEVLGVPAIVSGGEIPRPPDGAKVQEVIHRWLWQQAGREAPRDIFVWTTDPRAPARERDELTPYVDRFAALSPQEQRTWLEAHYADLRAGKLTLDDLP